MATTEEKVKVGINTPKVKAKEVKREIGTPIGIGTPKATLGIGTPKVAAKEAKREIGTPKGIGTPEATETGTPKGIGTPKEEEEHSQPRSSTATAVAAALGGRGKRIAAPEREVSTHSTMKRETGHRTTPGGGRGALSLQVSQAHVEQSQRMRAGCTVVRRPGRVSGCLVKLLKERSARWTPMPSSVAPARSS